MTRSDKRLTVRELHEYALDLTYPDDELRTVPHRVLASMACEILQRREEAVKEFGHKVLEPIVGPGYLEAIAHLVVPEGTECMRPGCKAPATRYLDQGAPRHDLGPFCDDHAE